ncbi:hypothetical protein DIZ76_014274 [Coccidioides immitis]|nr:hypothetical protein DIZ76_014274 [Coccidioides immitis]
MPEVLLEHLDLNKHTEQVNRSLLFGEWILKEDVERQLRVLLGELLPKVDLPVCNTQNRKELLQMISGKRSGAAQSPEAYEYSRQDEFNGKYHMVRIAVEVNMHVHHLKNLLCLDNLPPDSLDELNHLLKEILKQSQRLKNGLIFKLEKLLASHEGNELGKEG